MRQTLRVWRRHGVSMMSINFALDLLLFDYISKISTPDAVNISQLDVRKPGMKVGRVCKQYRVQTMPQHVNRKCRKLNRRAW